MTRRIAGRTQWGLILLTRTNMRVSSRCVTVARCSRRFGVVGLILRDPHDFVVQRRYFALQAVHLAPQHGVAIIA